MKFRLQDKAGKQFHEGVMPRRDAPPVLTWAARAFLRSKVEDDTATYREADSYRVGNV